MWRLKMTARPGRARRFGGALGLLLLSSVAALPVQAMQASPLDPAAKAAMDKRAAARSLLSSALARIAANANDVTALLDAGRASIDLEDHRAALGFLLRAEQAQPRDGAIKAALGTAMVHLENPTRALDYFGEAQLLGVPERMMLADRALARDLMGQQDAAQRDYQLALSLGPNDETQRRYALSLGISGDVDRAVQILTPQLRAQNRAAWRSRAMILAINGRDKEATDIVNATLPPALAQNILPYLVQMDRLNPAQQAAAAHFGRFPSGELGPKRKKPVQMAAATPAPAPVAPATSRRKSGSESARGDSRVLPAPVSGAKKPREAIAAAVPAKPAATTPAPVRQPAQVAAAPVATAPASAVAAPKPIPMLIGTQPPASASAADAPTSAPSSSPSAAEPVLLPSLRSSIRPMPQPAPSEPAPAAIPQQAPVPAAPVPVSPPPEAVPSPVPTSAPAPVSVPASASAPVAPIGVAVRESAEPVGPGFSIADVGRQIDAPAAAPVAMPPAASALAAPLASLAEIASSIEIPPEELSRPDNAIGADVLLRLQEDKRRADAEAAAKREKDAAAKAKAEADTRAKAEADAKAKEEAAQKKASPARLWVQIATGANQRALDIDYGRFAKKNPDVFKGKAGATAEWGRTRRLLVGPFADRKAAQDWLASYKKAGGDGFLFNSEAGQAVDPVK